MHDQFVVLLSRNIYHFMIVFQMIVPIFNARVDILIHDLCAVIIYNIYTLLNVV